MEPLAATLMRSGEACFIGEDGAPLVEAEVSMRLVPGALETQKRTSDARGCVPLAGLSEGLFQPGVRFVWGFVNVYLRDGDVAQLRLSAGEVTYADPQSLSATLNDLAAWKGFSEQERAAQIDDALAAPRGSTPRLAGLLASLSLKDYTGSEGGFATEKPSESAARELLDTLPPESPLLTAWPTGPVGAALVMGRAPLEDQLVDTIVRRHPEPGVGAAILSGEMQRAATTGEIARAKTIHRRLTSERYEGTFGWVDAVTRFKHLRAGPHAGAPPPRVTVRDEHGRKRNLVARGRPTLVYFWSSYCGPCKQGPAHLRELAAQYGKRLAIVSVSIDDEATTAQEFRNKRGGMPGLVIDGADNPGLAKDLGILGVPDVFVFDGDATVHRGAKWSKVEEALARVLGEGATHETSR